MSRKGAPGPNYRCKFVLRGHKKAISSVKFSPDGLWLATSSADGTCRIWDVETGAFDKALEGHEEGISDVAWAGSSKYLATASDDKTIKMWELASVRVRSLSSGDGGGEGTKGWGSRRTGQVDRGMRPPPRRARFPRAAPPFYLPTLTCIIIARLLRTNLV